MSEEKGGILKETKKKSDKGSKKTLYIILIALLVIAAVGWGAMSFLSDPAPKEKKAPSSKPAKAAQSAPVAKSAPVAQEVQEPEPESMLPDPLTVNFRYRSYHVNKHIRKQIRGLLNELETPAGLVFHIDAYTCRKGKKSYNKWVSKQRALQVRRYLMRRGVAKSAITYAYHGEADPVGNNKTRSGRRANRRAVITVTPTD